MGIEFAKRGKSVRWELRIGSPVECQDGHAGSVERVVVSPRTREVTHLVVHRGLLLHHDVTVPIEAVESADDEVVRLRLTAAELNEQDPYRPHEYVQASDGWEPPHEFEPNDVVFALPRSLENIRQLEPASSGETEHANIGADEGMSTITAGTAVHSRDGYVGKVDVVLLDAESRRATHLVVRRGPFFGHDLIVPVDWAIKVDDERIDLDVGRAQLDKLPEYRPDDELAADVDDALWNDEILRRVDLPMMRAVVRDGIVTLEGHVVTSAHRARAEEVVRHVHGVLDVRTALVADDELEIAVAQALGHDPRTRSKIIQVSASQGIVQLSGDVVPVAQEIAASVPGVRQVEIGSQHATYR